MESVRQGEKNSGLARAVLRIVSRPRRERVTVSIKKLNDNAKERESIIVPGKILSVGAPDKKYDVCAVEYSDAAAEKLRSAGCSMVPVQEMIKREGVRLVI